MALQNSRKYLFTVTANSVLLPSIQKYITYYTFKQSSKNNAANKILNCSTIHGWFNTILEHWHWCVFILMHHCSIKTYDCSIRVSWSLS